MSGGKSEDEICTERLGAKIPASYPCSPQWRIEDVFEKSGERLRRGSWKNLVVLRTIQSLTNFAVAHRALLRPRGEGASAPAGV